MLIRGTSRWHPEQTTTDESDLVLAPRLSEGIAGLTFGSTGLEVFEVGFLASLAGPTFFPSLNFSASGNVFKR